MKIEPETGWRELPRGGMILEAGNAVEYETGGWRAFRPVWNREKCRQCLICWIHCPDSSIMLKDGKVVGIDYAHCKGCGICSEVCPPRAQAIEMVSE